VFYEKCYDCRRRVSGFNFIMLFIETRTSSYGFRTQSRSKSGEAERGRSINLALSDRGWRSLEKIGLAEKVRPIAIPMNGRMIHHLDNSTTYQQYGNDGQAIYSVSRGDLNKLMIEAADEFPHVDFKFNQRCVDVNFDKTTLTFRDTKTNTETVHEAETVFGADGAFSEVRYAMQRTPNFNFSQTYEAYGYKELHIPDKDGLWQLEKNALHIWPRTSFMMIALPNMDGSFTCTLFAPLEGENSFASIKTDEDIRAYFQQALCIGIEVDSNTGRGFQKKPNINIGYYTQLSMELQNVCLIGDAAHGIVPFFGQGMNCGFEDVQVLDELMDVNADLADLFSAFGKSRKPNSDAIATLALNNYIEMRDLAARPEFQLRLKIEKRIAAAFPEQFQTSYSMVTFSHKPYAVALKKVRQQSQLLDEIMRLNNIADTWESEEVLTIAKKWIDANA
jgi:kynurenine 3-monooxygenase